MIGQARRGLLALAGVCVALGLSPGCGADPPPLDTSADGANSGDVSLGADGGSVVDSASSGDSAAPADSSLDAVAVSDTIDAARCDPSSGLIKPLLACSDLAPCESLGVGEPAEVRTRPTEIPTCATSKQGRAVYDDGPPKQATGSDGATRYACEYRPPGTSQASPRPLVLWFHGAFGGADDLYNGTSLRTKAVDYDLSGDPTRPGFILVAVQGRNTHWPTEDPRDGAHHDIYHRDLAAPSTNPDLANADRIIDALVAEGVVDPAAVYVMGWSNGGFFAQLYAIARHEGGTPGGQRVAAASVYTAADPFHDITAEQLPSCRLDPYPRSTVPLFIASRACDIIACSEAQAARFRDAGRSVSPGAVVETWVSDLATRVGDPNITWRIIKGDGTRAASCTAPGLCLFSLATVNHMRWPDGVADGGDDHEPAMLTSLRSSRL